MGDKLWAAAEWVFNHRFFWRVWFVFYLTVALLAIVFGLASDTMRNRALELEWENLKR